MKTCMRTAWGLVTVIAVLGCLAGCNGTSNDEDDDGGGGVDRFTDLVLTLVSAPDCAAQGEVIGDRINCTVRNAGNKGFETAFTCRVYIANPDPAGDPVLEAMPEGIAIFQGIGAGQSIDFNFGMGTIPPSRPVGSVTYTIQADFLGQVSESSSSNNYQTFEITIYDPAVSAGCGGAPLPVQLGHPVQDQIGVGPLPGGGK